MSCLEFEPELVGYHFGTVADETRARLEEHLLDCRGCLRAFLDLKRAIETGESEPAPSPAARARLRGAVVRELGLEHRGWSWWERPLAFGLAGSAVMAAMLAAQVLTSGPGAPPRTAPAAPAPAAPLAAPATGR